MTSKVENFQSKIADLTNASDHQLKVIALWMVHYRRQCGDFIPVWFECFGRSNMDVKCKLVSIIDAVLGADKGKVYQQQFWPLLKPVFTHFFSTTVSPDFKNLVMTVLQSWAARGLFDKKQLENFVQILTQSKIKCYENELAEVHAQLVQVRVEQLKFLENNLSGIDVLKLTSYDVIKCSDSEKAALLEELEHALELQTQGNEFLSREIKLNKKTGELVAKIRRYRGLGFPLSSNTVQILAETAESENVAAATVKIEELEAKIQKCSLELSGVQEAMVANMEKQTVATEQFNQYLDIFHLMADAEVIVEEEESQTVLEKTDDGEATMSRKRLWSQREM